MAVAVSVAVGSSVAVAVGASVAVEVGVSVGVFVAVEVGVVVGGNGVSVGGIGVFVGSCVASIDLGFSVAEHAVMIRKRAKIKASFIVEFIVFNM